MNIILLATAWGPKAGGVNAFNEDFALGLASYQETKSVFCLVPRCDPSERAAADAAGVCLIEVPEADETSRPFDKIAATILPYHPDLPAIGPEDIWVGHDVLTGQAAKGAAQESGSKSALIMHMDHEAYVGARDNDSQKAHQRHNDQLELFTGADYHFAVGPLLRAALRDMVGEGAKMLVPGMPEIDPQTAKHQLRCVAFGRLEARNDLVKQASLASAAFGRAQQEMQGCEDLKTLSATLTVLGVPSCDEKRLLQFADDHANGIAHVLALPYEENRKKLNDILSRANLAIVPSFHDGFALTGWEAIAAETPLIVGENTGLWRLLAEFWSPGFAKTVANSFMVRAARSSGESPPFTEEDVATLAKLILESARNLETRVRVAVRLKDYIHGRRDGCTWRRTAEEFLIGVERIKDPAKILKSFEGRWTGFFVEGSTELRPPEILQETIVLRLRTGRDELEGGSDYAAAEGDRAEKFTNIKFQDGVLVGETHVTTGATQQSCGRFQLARRCEGKLLDGIAHWPSTIMGEIDWSRYIWVRNEPANDDLLEFAQRAMLAEQAAVAARIQQRRSNPVPVDRSCSVIADA
ncbi:MAG: hypothetical protein IPK66_17480 [Rhodospirillales bacterium]|nr:hypothetical protein [Rhodospirillales bacterium]